MAIAITHNVIDNHRAYSDTSICGTGAFAVRQGELPLPGQTEARAFDTYTEDLSRIARI